MKIVRILIAGIAAAVLSAVVGGLTCGWLFRWVYDLEPTNVWKPMECPPGVETYVGILVLGILLAVVYALLKKGIPSKNVVGKGIVFGLCVWVVGILPGMWATYSFMTVNTTFVIYMTLHGLVMSPIKGIVIAAICGK